MKATRRQIIILSWVDQLVAGHNNGINYILLAKLGKTKCANIWLKAYNGLQYKYSVQKLN